MGVPIGIRACRLMGKNTQSATSSDPDAVIAATDARQEHLRTQVEGFSDSIIALETQQTTLQKSFKRMNSSTATFQNHNVLTICSVSIVNAQ